MHFVGEHPPASRLYLPKPTTASPPEADGAIILPAAQAFAGIDVGITENVAIGGRVRWLHLSDVDLVDDEDHEHSLDPDGILSAEAVLTFGF